MTRLKLVDLDSGEEIIPDKNGNLTIQVTYPDGVKKGDTMPFKELIPPSDENPKGLVVGRAIGMCWNEYYPEVFNAKIVYE